MRSIFACVLVLLAGVVGAEEPKIGVGLDSEIVSGVGSYELQLRQEAVDGRVEVFYYKPEQINEDTSVIIVIPGAGRNADDYRDSWIDNAEKYNLLVLSPAYPKERYDFAAYHLGGLVTDLALENPTIEKLNGRITKYRMKDEDITFSFVTKREDWIFEDFDKIFESVKSIIGSKQTGYDLFGHSAGGQILHRFAIFKKNSNAKRIVAANSGFYTLPDTSVEFPFGTKGTKLDNNGVADAFANTLILLLGESDDKNETRGTMLHTAKADEQGLGRFERGHYFYEASKRKAESLGGTFNWQLKPVAGVGHEYKRMGEAAAKILYEK